jgi:glycogen synthase
VPAGPIPAFQAVAATAHNRCRRQITDQEEAMASDTFEVPILRPDAWSFADVEASTVLPAWRHDRTALAALFSRTELRRLDAGRAVAGPRTVVFLSYENRWARSGGIAAIAAMLPAELAAAGEQVIRLSPLHAGLRTAPPGSSLESCGACSVVHDGVEVPVSVCMAVENGREWYLFEAPGFFDADGGAGGADPYVFGDETRAHRDGEGSKLLRDALFAAKAIPAVLATLAREGGISRNLVVHAQDWELAAVALTVKEALLAGPLKGFTASVLLTLHNPYDHALSNAALARITSRVGPERWPLVHHGNHTMLAHMIPLADAPISTVSRRFAQELTTDPLQTAHFAAHYQEILVRQGVIGIDNGLFAQVPGPAPALDKAMAAARRGRAGPLLELKLASRQRALRELDGYLRQLAAVPNPNEPVFGTLDGGTGRPLGDLPGDVPVFLMTGRLDPGQKGFDVFAAAIAETPAGLGRYIISPLSPMAFDPDIRANLDYLEDLAERRPGEVVVLPFRIADIYADLVRGVTWSVWPSLYEPFGGVTEPYVWLTPVIARATGGLVQQVVDFDISPIDATGLLYRETVPAGRAWQEAAQRAMQGEQDPAARASSALFRAQATALREAIVEAAGLYRDRPGDYARLIANLAAMCRVLDWGRSVRDYRTWYDSASR